MLHHRDQPALVGTLWLDRSTLDSTETARRFYRSAGYSEELPPRQIFGTLSYPMSKRLGGAA